MNHKHARVIIANSVQQISNFTSKLMTHTITILNIHNYEQKENNKTKEERRKALTQSYQLRCGMHLNHASLKWIHEA